MIRISFPGDITVACHVDVFVLNGRSWVEGDCAIPYVIGICVIFGGESHAVGSVPISKSRNIPANFDGLPELGGDSVSKCDSN